MRIILANTRHFYGGGDSTCTFNLAHLLQSKGHKVAFFAMQDSRNLPDPNSDLFVSHIDFRELNRHKSLRTGLQVLGQVIYSREARHKFSTLIDRFQPDIVHLQNIHVHITPSIIFEARKCGLPVVWTLHDYKLVCPNAHYLIDSTGEICEACGQGQYYESILKRCKKGSLLASAMAAMEAYAHRLMQVREQADAFLSPSIFLRNKFIERGFSPEVMHHLPYAVPTEMFSSDNNTDQGYLLFLGRLEPIKGIRPLLEACRRASGVKLLLAGRIEEPLARELPALLPPNAHYVGLKHGKELRELLCNALAIVAPSLWYENQPFSILEAFACGKPVIASDLGGMTELITHSVRGLLVRAGDVQELSEAMLWMMKHPAEAREMGQKAREYTLAEHGSERYYQQLIDLYENVRKGKPYGLRSHHNFSL